MAQERNSLPIGAVSNAYMGPKKDKMLKEKTTKYFTISVLPNIAIWDLEIKPRKI